jgi:hypothetical protein
MYHDRLSGGLGGWLPDHTACNAPCTDMALLTFEAISIPKKQ